MEPRALDFLRRLLDAPGPSGYEQAPAAVWRAEAETFADEVTRDVIGNAFARVGTPGGPRVLIEGHIDEIGFLVTHIDETGYLWFDQIGGWDDPVAVGQRVRIAAAGGDVRGVVGRKAAHLIRREEPKRPLSTRDLWIDIGASDRDDARRRVAVGDPAVIDAPFLQLTDDLCVARSMDNRVGAFVALEAARLLAAERPAAEVWALAATQEEVSFAGAYTATFRVAPTVAIAIDVTHATDYPGADKKSDGEVALGGGPVLSRGASINPVVFAGLRDAAGRLGIDCPVQGAARASGTDADAMIRTAAGTATGLVSIPNRYMHSPNEVVSLRDLEQAARLIAAFVSTVTADTDFRP
ncbi:MAG: Probable endoglucanase [uncultured Thermomicrobiales bacterium]|uniref:Probable endoglucanase n=1 Tax=uncultured Thermomicrobiales bacterium TaxID=1645740 RepID=A0A6J4TYZ3_9BACT|nr:MAG: Probable endoglucanase [uncultured Thermomicrobiales bacterium]